MRNDADKQSQAYLLHTASTALSVKLKQNWQYISHDLKAKVRSFKAKWDEALAIMTAGLQYNKKTSALTVLFLPQLETCMMWKILCVKVEIL